jgi:hypothetical protein
MRRLGGETRPCKSLQKQVSGNGLERYILMAY